MEQYVYFSIIFFSLIILSLYIYIIYEKSIEVYIKKRLKKYYRRLSPYIEYVINRIMDGEEANPITLDNLKHACRNKDKRAIIAEKLAYYLENFKGDFIPKIISICEYVGVVDYEIKNLKNKNLFKKTLAAKRLGEFRSKKAVPALLKGIEVNNDDLKYNILLALAKIGEEDVFIKAFENINSLVILSDRSLIEIVDSFEGDKTRVYKHMINSNNNFISSLFIRSAGNHKEQSLSKDISMHLFSENMEIKIAAVKATGNIGDKRYLDDLIRLLEDSEWEVRAVTAKALSNFNDEKILMPLVKVLSDSQWYVRYNAAASILSNKEGLSVISHVFNGKDKFAKDIFISAMENSPNNALSLYENSDNPRYKEIAAQVKGYIEMRNQEVKV